MQEQRCNYTILCACPISMYTLSGPTPIPNPIRTVRARILPTKISGRCTVQVGRSDILWGIWAHQRTSFHQVPSRAQAWRSSRDWTQVLVALLLRHSMPGMSPLLRNLVAGGSQFATHQSFAMMAIAPQMRPATVEKIRQDTLLRRRLQSSRSGPAPSANRWLDSFLPMLPPRHSIIPRFNITWPM